MLSENIEEAIKVAKLTKELTEVIGSLTIENWFILVVILVWIILNKGYLFRLFEISEQHKRRKLEMLNSYIILPKEEVDQNTREALIEIRNEFHFFQQTKIKQGERMRHVLISLHSQHSDSLTWKQIQSALPFLRLDPDSPNNIRVVFDLYDKVGYILNRSLGYFFLVSFAVTFSTLILFRTTDVQKVVIWASVGLLFAALSVFFFSVSYPIDYARRIGRLTSRPSKNTSVKSEPK